MRVKLKTPIQTGRTYLTRKSVFDDASDGDLELSFTREGRFFPDGWLRIHIRGKSRVWYIPPMEIEYVTFDF